MDNVVYDKKCTKSVNFSYSLKTVTKEGNGEERVRIWLTKHKEGPQITSFLCMFLSFFTVYTRKMPFFLLPPVDLRRP